MRKWLIPIVYLSIFIGAIVYKEPISNWIQYGDAPVSILFPVAVIIALFPFVPFGIIGGIMGAKYGVLAASIMNVASSSLAAIVMFWLVRLVYAEAGRAYLARYSKTEFITAMFEKNAFFSVFFMRIIPIMPAQIVNVYSAISRMSFISFAAATLLGKIPVMLMFAWIGDQLMSPGRILLIVSMYAVFLASVYGCYRFWMKGRTGA